MATVVTPHFDNQLASACKSAVKAPKAAVATVYILMYRCCMSRRYSIAEARSRLSSIVDEAESGIEVELTRHGQPVAVLVSHREFERHSPEGIGVEGDFAVSTRDRTVGRKVSL